MQNFPSVRSVVEMSNQREWIELELDSEIHLVTPRKVGNN